MEIDEVVDQETLKAYLAALPYQERCEVSLRVATKAAARVLPVAVYGFSTDDEALGRDVTQVAIFGAVVISWVARKMPIREIATAAGAAVTTAISSHAATANSVASATISAASIAALAAPNTDANPDPVAVALAATNSAASLNMFNHWQIVRLDLAADRALWPGGPPAKLQEIWSKSVTVFRRHPADWSIWIHWYNRILQDRDWHPEAIGAVLAKITQDDWEKGPAHINPMFDEVLALYLEEDAATSDVSGQDRSTNHLKTIRAQVFALQEFLQAEYLNLAGHNARNPEQDDILELLKALKALVEDMIAQLDRSDDDGALVIVRETLPVVVEKAGELAVIEPEPVVSSTVATMSATIRSLTEAGADPELATKFAISEAAGKKLWPRIKGLFGRQ